MLRGVIGDTPFADFPIIASISEAVGKIEAVSATVGNKFAEAPI